MRRMSVAGSFTTQSPGLQFFMSATSRSSMVMAATSLGAAGGREMPKPLRVRVRGGPGEGGGGDVGGSGGGAEEADPRAIRRAEGRGEVAGGACKVGRRLGSRDNAEDRHVTTVMRLQHFHHGLTALERGELRGVEADALCEKAGESRRGLRRSLEQQKQRQHVVSVLEQ